MASTKEILHDISPVIKIYTDGTVDRLFAPPYVPPCPEGDPATGVFSKDTSTPPLSRLYLPCKPSNTSDQKLPIVLYFYGGGFCIGSPFSSFDHRYLRIQSLESKALIISVEYRLAPEHHLPAAYEDSWEALKWVCSHALEQTHFEKEPWIANHGDLSRIFVVGDSAGGNIAHNLVLRAGSEPLPGNTKISGVILSHPYFLGSNLIGDEPKKIKEHAMGPVLHRLWVDVAYPNAAGGIDNPLINPMADGAPSLSELGCEKMLVCVSEKDVLKDRGHAYVEKLRESGWKGAVEVVEVEGEDHCFHIFDPESEKAKNLIHLMASFVNSQ